jgi:hypothetical protein
VPNRIEKLALVTYVPGSPAVPYQPAYCIPNTLDYPIRTMGVNRTNSGTTGMLANSTQSDSYVTVVLPSNQLLEGINSL